MNLIKIKLSPEHSAAQVADIQKETVDAALALLKTYPGASWGKDGSPLLSMCFRDDQHWVLGFFDHFAPHDFEKMEQDPIIPTDFVAPPPTRAEKVLDFFANRFDLPRERKPQLVSPYMERCLVLQHCVAKAIALLDFSPSAVVVEKDAFGHAEDIVVDVLDLKVQKNQDVKEFMCYVRQCPYSECETMNGSVKKPSL